MSEPELVKTVATAFEAIGVPYMLTGSVASSLQGQPRSSHDIDLVAMLMPGKVPAVLKVFHEPEFYVSEEAIRQAIKSR